MHKLLYNASLYTVRTASLILLNEVLLIVLGFSLFSIEFKRMKLRLYECIMTYCRIYASGLYDIYTYESSKDQHLLNMCISLTLKYNNTVGSYFSGFHSRFWQWSFSFLSQFWIMESQLSLLEFKTSESFKAIHKAQEVSLSTWIPPSS